LKYIVQVDDRLVEVQLDGDGVKVDGARVDAHVTDVEGTPVRLVTVGTQVHRVLARRHPGKKGRYTLSLDGHRYEVEALDERTRTIRELTAAASGPAGPAPLVAPMPGLVVRVSVQAGDQVVPGQGLVVVEAMKMENELRASAAATVKAVLVQPGQTVEKGTLLVEME
jgi:biotin carboxyl carrier protein